MMIIFKISYLYLTADWEFLATGKEGCAMWDLKTGTIDTVSLGLNPSFAPH